MDFSNYFHIRQQRVKARQLRDSQWWRQQIGIGVCYYCKKSFAKHQLTMDHRVPLARGGRSNKTNLVVACKACNVTKSNLLPDEVR